MNLNIVPKRRRITPPKPDFIDKQKEPVKHTLRRLFPDVTNNDAAIMSSTGCHITNKTVEDTSATSNVNYVIKGTKSGCVMRLKQNENIDMSMRYPNDLLIAEFAKAQTVLFDPSVYMEISGEVSDYNLAMISNDGYAPTDWYCYQ